MAKIIRTYTQQVPESRFVGIKYGDGDRSDGMFAHKWGEWMRTSRFTELEGANGFDKTFREDGDSYIGLARRKDSDPFEVLDRHVRPAGNGGSRGLRPRRFRRA
ncbi:MAG: hypothetical protein LBC78_01680 [Oscillospiraceae bacterium]|nr:hypothetical protein [Oscillospiraceae bacterium]